jgi:hypothetical protein
MTNYHLNKCSICGKYVCDLCLGYSSKEAKKESPKGICHICDEFEIIIGQNRKYWLKEEYK